MLWLLCDVCGALCVCHCMVRVAFVCCVFVVRLYVFVLHCVLCVACWLGCGVCCLLIGVVCLLLVVWCRLDVGCWSMGVG